MEKFYNLVCWIGVGVLVVFGVTVVLFRAAAIAWLTVWMVLFSSLPWWERVLAPAAVIAGMVYLFRRSGSFSGYTGSLSRRIPPHPNFVHFASEPREKRSPISPKTEDL